MITHANLESSAEKRVSYILPVKNHAEELRKTLESCRSLLKPDDELIVLDDASQDHTKRVVEEYADLINVFISEPDFNCTHAVNKGMLLARGKYIKSLSDDDILHPHAMERAIRIMERHPEIDLLLCGGTKEKNGKITHVYVPPGVNYGKRAEDIFKYSRCGVGHIYRRSALSRVGLFDWKNPGLDVEYLLRFIASGAGVKFCRVNLFHHPFSHYGEKSSLRKFWKKAVRRYCSYSFYLKYSFRQFYKNTVLYGKWQQLRKRLRRASGKKKKMELVWDGDLS